MTIDEIITAAGGADPDPDPDHEGWLILKNEVRVQHVRLGARDRVTKVNPVTDKVFLSSLGGWYYALSFEPCRD